MSIKCTTRIEPRISDIDFMNHVHSTKFLEYVFAARFKETESRYRELTDYLVRNHLVWVVSRVEIDYRRQLKLSDVIEVCTWTETVSEKSSTVGFSILKNGDNVAAEGVIIFTLIDHRTGKSIIIPDEVREMSNRVEASEGNPENR